MANLSVLLMDDNSYCKTLIHQYGGGGSQNEGYPFGVPIGRIVILVGGSVLGAPLFWETTINELTRA